MAVYFICYDLVKDKDYTKLTDELENMGAFRVILSDWCVELDNTTCKEIKTHLLDYIDEDDRLLVVKKGSAPAWSTHNALHNPT